MFPPPPQTSRIHRHHLRTLRSRQPIHRRRRKYRQPAYTVECQTQTESTGKIHDGSFAHTHHTVAFNELIPINSWRAVKFDRVGLGCGCPSSTCLQAQTRNKQSYIYRATFSSNTSVHRERGHQKEDSDTCIPGCPIRLRPVFFQSTLRPGIGACID